MLTDLLMLTGVLRKFFCAPSGGYHRTLSRLFCGRCSRARTGLTLERPVRKELPLCVVAPRQYHDCCAVALLVGASHPTAVVQQIPRDFWASNPRTSQHLARNITSEAFARAVRPAIPCANPKTNHCTPKRIRLTDSPSVGELRRPKGQKKTYVPKRATLTVLYRGMTQGAPGA